jgi:hypothetical protein
MMQFGCDNTEINKEKIQCFSPALYIRVASYLLQHAACPKKLYTEGKAYNIGIRCHPYHSKTT